MHLRGHKTTFQTRLEKSRVCRCWSERHPNCRESWLLRVDGSQMATTMAKAWARRLHLADRSPCHRLDEHFSRRITASHPAPAPAPSWLGAEHPVNGTQDGCLLDRSAAAESSRNSPSAQTCRPHAPRPPASRLAPTPSCGTLHSPSRMADGRGIRIMRVEGVGKVSLITVVDVVSRLKAESYPS